MSVSIPFQQIGSRPRSPSTAADSSLCGLGRQLQLAVVLDFAESDWDCIAHVLAHTFRRVLEAAALEGLRPPTTGPCGLTIRYWPQLQTGRLCNIFFTRTELVSYYGGAEEILLQRARGMWEWGSQWSLPEAIEYTVHLLADGPLVEFCGVSTAPA